VLLPFGLGLGILFLSLYKGRSANRSGRLTGQIVAVDSAQLSWLAGTGAIVLIGLITLWRPSVFASLVLSTVCTPAAAAVRVTASRVVPSVAFAVCSTVGGILVAPAAPYRSAPRWLV
jgi:zinc/manganese transport system permease protein